jgi:hypothetical protein
MITSFLSKNTYYFPSSFSQSRGAPAWGLFKIRSFSPYFSLLAPKSFVFSQKIAFWELCKLAV